MNLPYESIHLSELWHTFKDKKSHDFKYPMMFSRLPRLQRLWTRLRVVSGNRHSRCFKT